MLTSRWARAGAWTAAGVLGAGLASGIGWAAASGTSSSHASAHHGVGAKAHHVRGRRLRRGHRLIRRIEHGSLTLRAKSADLTVDLQRGVVSNVSPTALTVTSRDGYAATYDVTSTAKIRADRPKSSISAVQDGDKVFVTASGGDVRRLFDPRPGHTPKASSSATG